MKKYILYFSVLAFFFSSFKNDKPAYRIFNEDGKKVKYKELIKKASEADVVFFGEYHNNPITHWLQLELTKDLHEANNGNIILGAEMFETDNQLILDEYLKGIISQKSFENEARLWPNYKTDYKPLVEFSKENELDFIASNVPRRYASLVHKKGLEALDSLDEHTKFLLPPLPIEYDPELGCYKTMMEMMMGAHANPNLPKAQAIKDATMGYFISENFSDGSIFIHYNGAFHSDNYEGIIWYLNNYNDALKILTISTVEQSDIDTLATDNQGIADFIICVPDDMTKTH